MEENANKNLHGANGLKSLRDMLDALKQMNYIVSYENNYWLADPEYGKKQFYFQYMIEFYDKEQWLLQSTTSIRDRINQQQWHSEQIKRLNYYVKKAYVVVPDTLNEKEKNNVEKYNQNIINKRIYSAIDGVVPFTTAYSMIEKKAAELMSSGAAHAKLGLNFEKKVVDAFNNRQNLDKWKNGTETTVGYLYTLFYDIVNKIGLNKEEVISFYATSDIPKLPSGGMPKTDVLLKVNTNIGEEIHTFSCKRSNHEWVSVHEYTADVFAQVLNPSDKELKELLIDFQNAGGIKALGSLKEAQLTATIQKYEARLAKWVIGGVEGEGDPCTQWADYIITLNDESGRCVIHSINEYVIECKKKGVIGQLGTMFKWTYPSGGKGKRIQLKGKML